jgi:tRNA(fMet)-specific endonuclease VapC
VAELRAGFLVGTKGRENERVLRQVLASPRVSILYATEATTRQHARLYLQLRTQGTPIPTNDLWIAALVLENDIALFSRDAHFDRLPQLPRAA